MDVEAYVNQFNGATDLDYLRLHFHRFLATKKLSEQRWSWDTATVLDIGAHWLHQAVLFSQEGHRIIAADFENPLGSAEARQVAADHGMEVLIYDDLDDESVFDALPANSVDVVLFCEILEHITFNPVAMWRAIYRVLKPGGRIILTTPNFYNYRRIPRQVFRYLFGMGSGITVEDMLQIPTNSPHWKEYSLKEIRSYFEALSRDFSFGALRYCCWKSASGQINWKGRLVHDLPGVIPFLREGIYAEIDLVRKESGVIEQPRWGRTTESW